VAIVLWSLMPKLAKYWGLLLQGGLHRRRSSDCTGAIGIKLDTLQREPFLLIRCRFALRALERPTAGSVASSTMSRMY